MNVKNVAGLSLMKTVTVINVKIENSGSSAGIDFLQIINLN